MASMRLRPNRGSTSLLRRSIVTSARLAESQFSSDQSSPYPSSSSSSSSDPQVRNSKTFEFLYGADSNWRKPKVPSKPPTPPKKRPKVDPEAYKNLPPLENASTRERLIHFSLAEGQSNERRAYFANDIEGELGEDWSNLEIVEGEVGLESGRVVECRRSGHITIGLILASITLSGRPRLLLLRSSGEIWPVSSHDVQFVMPTSLISPSLAAQCWSPELLESLSQIDTKSGLAEENDSIQPTPEMLSARRKVAMILRKVHRETEKMCGRLMAGSFRPDDGHRNGGQVGGIESVWQNWTTKESGNQRKSITAVQAAEFILNPSDTKSQEEKKKKIEVRPNTLPAYAAHVLLMRRPDLFTADQGDMWQSGTFIVRSRSERTLLDSVQKGIDGSMDIGKSGSTDEALLSFVEKAKAVVEKSRKLREESQGKELTEVKEDGLPEWTDKDKEHISILLSPLTETRSTQTPPSLPLALSIVRLISPSSDEVVDRGTLARLLSDLGVIVPWDSLGLSKITESENRSMIMCSIPTGIVKGEEKLLKGNELDSLREDFTSHKVFVIDDPIASELDDGISLERIPNSDDVWVHIHIADPTIFIPPNHPLAKQASVRGSSTYLPEANKPLFPLDVIMKELSLGAEVSDNNGAQGTMTFSAKVNRKGEVDETEVRMGWIKKPKVITYQAVDQALGLPTSKSTRPFGGPVKLSDTTKMDIEQSDLEDLKTLYEIAKAHRARRYATAGLEWNLPSASITLLNKPFPPPTNLFDPLAIPSTPRLFSGSLDIDYRVSSSIIGGTNAAGLVAEYMIMAGRLSAAFCSSRNIPVIYRGSFAPRPLSSEVGTLEDLLSSRQEGTGQIDYFRLMDPAWYRTPGYVDTKPIPHWIMGFDDSSSPIGYIRATSPLRRFDDFLVHWQIKSFLAREANIGKSHLEKGYSKEEVIGLIKRSDEGLKRAKRAGINANKYWQARVIQKYLQSEEKRNGKLRLPQGWEIKDDEKIPEDGIFTAKIAGSTDSVPSLNGEATPIIIEQLGLQAFLNHRVLGGKEGWKIGEEVKCKIRDVQDWPNPMINFDLVD